MYYPHYNVGHSRSGRHWEHLLERQKSRRQARRTHRGHTRACLETSEVPNSVQKLGLLLLFYRSTPSTTSMKQGGGPVHPYWGAPIFLRPLSWEKKRITIEVLIALFFFPQATAAPVTPQTNLVRTPFFVFFLVVQCVFFVYTYAHGDPSALPWGCLRARSVFCFCFCSTYLLNTCSLWICLSIGVHLISIFTISVSGEVWSSLT